MIFDDEMKVITSTLNREEAVAFCKFLKSEVLRHQIDIEQAERLMLKIMKEWGIEKI